MPCYVGLDVSKRTTSISVLDRAGVEVRKGVVPTDPASIIAFLRGERRRYALVGIEAASLAPWLYEGLAKAGLPVVCIEVRHAHDVLKRRRNKTDRNDALGIAENMRTGLYRTVHIKSQAAQETRALIAARRLLKTKAKDVDSAIRGLLLASGLKLVPLRRKTFDERVRALFAKRPFVRELIEPLLAVRTMLRDKALAFEGRILTLARADPVCTKLITAPCVGWLTAITYRSCIDEPARFARSRNLGPHLGLTPKTLQSGERVRHGRITCWGDRMTRTALFNAARGLIRKRIKASWLSDWGKALAARRGAQKAIVALARRLAIVLHRMWMDGSEFRWKPSAA